MWFLRALRIYLLHCGPCTMYGKGKQINKQWNAFARNLACWLCYGYMAWMSSTRGPHSAHHVFWQIPQANTYSQDNIDFSRTTPLPSSTVASLSGIEAPSHRWMHVISMRKETWVSFSGQLTEATIKRRKCLYSCLFCLSPTSRLVAHS